MNILDLLNRIFYKLEDILYDKMYRLDFSSSIAPAVPINDCSSAYMYAYPFQSVWRRNLRVIFAVIARHSVHFTNFVDLGCGKGKACIFAATTKDVHFDNIIGIELDPTLIAVAFQNCLKLSIPNLNLSVSDATQYTLPNGNSVVFMFNPFNDEALKQFLNHNENHFALYDSYIAYANDMHRDVLIHAGFLQIYRDATRHLSLFAPPRILRF